MEFSRLSQSKSYLKLISIPYLFKKTNSYITFDEVDNILKNTHIFNNVVLASKPRVIKVSPKSDMAIIWIDIWDTQSGMKAKSLINRRFNVGSFIATICGTNMNPDVPQCKKCWKWDHSSGVYKVQEAKCIKCNRPYQTIYVTNLRP